mgnify:CR=1 FL=1
MAAFIGAASLLERVVEGTTVAAGRWFCPGAAGSAFARLVETVFFGSGSKVEGLRTLESGETRSTHLALFRDVSLITLAKSFGIVEVASGSRVSDQTGTLLVLESVEGT